MWYKTGSITVTNGSTTVSGAGTAWISNAAIGEALYAPDGKLYEITNIASDTSITITPAYLGATASAQPYVIVPSQSYIRDLAAQAADLVNNYSTIYNTVGQGKFEDGTLGTPAIRFSEDLDTGFYRSATNEVTFVAGGVAQFKYNTSGISFTTSPAFTTPISVTANSASNAFRITQTGTGNALLVEDSANPDSTPFVVDSNGNVGIGESSPSTYITKGLIVKSSSAFSPAVMTWNKANDASPSILTGRKDRNDAIVQSGDELYRIFAAGYDGAGYISAASITALVDGTPGTNDMPGRLVFSTTADGASSPTERMRIRSDGGIGIGGAGNAAVGVYLQKDITGSTTAYSLRLSNQIQSDVTSSVFAVRTDISTQAASFALTNLRHYTAIQGAIGAGSSIGNQYGFFADASLIGATNNYGFYSNLASGTGRWNFYANGTADNYFAGNVGIGTVSPSTKFTVSGNANVVGNLYTPDYGYIGNSGGTFSGINTGFQTLSGASGYLTALTNGNERMRIDSSGNLGLGVTPSAWSGGPALDMGSFTGLTSNGSVGAALTFNAYYNAGWKYKVTTAANAYVMDSAAHIWFTAPSGTAGAAISFTQAMTLNSSGTLLVGTTDSGITTGAGFKTTNNAQWLAVVSAASTSALSNFSMYSTGAGAYRFYVGWDGTINATSATISAISDQRLKENIRDLDIGLDAIMSVKPRRFDWKEGKGLNKKDDIGFIAQEFETVFPDSVSTSLAGSDGIDYKTVNHGGLIPALVKAIQELKAEIDLLKGN